MSARFRIVHFVPDPFAGSRIAIAAIVNVNGRWELARARSLPGVACAGGLRAYSTMQMILERLSATERFDRLPFSIGPQAVLGEEIEVPTGVSDPAAWVEAMVLPRLDDPDDQKDTKPRGPHRETLGYQVLQHYGVGEIVHRHLKTEGIPGVAAKAANDISHYVSGKSEVLLMEPVIATRANLSQDLTSISETFLAWRKLLELSPAKRHPRFIAYVMGPVAGFTEAQSVLRTAADMIVDIDNRSERTRFIEEIRRIGSTGGGSQTSFLH
ncbi:hypothetical protein [Hyalangium sp.]|uniref:hypothetical protein n=1 Tax=Hyalangium sp. TaxID=2028555 RepID=UPI002D2C7C12|nr:hypothetical protein [Hyalangium sp.]HYH96249.1 hypothetical protein [Hyalangium sp.]